MKVHVIGLKGSDYVSKKDNQRKIGIEIQAYRPPTTREAEASKGMILHPVYISSESPLYSKTQTLVPDSDIELVYEFDGHFNILSDICKVGGEKHA